MFCGFKVAWILGICVWWLEKKYLVREKSSCGFGGVKVAWTLGLRGLGVEIEYFLLEIQMLCIEFCGLVAWWLIGLLLLWPSGVVFCGFCSFCGLMPLSFSRFLVWWFGCFIGRCFVFLFHGFGGSMVLVALRSQGFKVSMCLEVEALGS